MNRLAAGILEVSKACNDQSLIACARHGAKGGQFEFQKWANGNQMVAIPGQHWIAIHMNQFMELKSNGWKIFVK